MTPEILAEIRYQRALLCSGWTSAVIHGAYVAGIRRTLIKNRIAELRRHA